jgi:hypothetical protein
MKNITIALLLALLTPVVTSAAVVTFTCRPTEHKLIFTCYMADEIIEEPTEEVEPVEPTPIPQPKLKIPTTVNR